MDYIDIDQIDQTDQTDQLDKIIKKDVFIQKFIFELLMPYFLYLYLIMSDNSIYKKIKKTKSKIKMNQINLYFLMEIIKKKIEYIR